VIYIINLKKVKMKNFKDYEFERKVSILKESILEAAAEIPDKELGDVIYDFFEDESNAPFQNPGLWQKARNFIGAARNQLNQDSVGKYYSQLNKSLDSFTKSIQNHPIGREQTDFLDYLSKLRSELGQRASQVGAKMKGQQGTQNPQAQGMQNSGQAQNSQGQGMQNSGQAQNSQGMQNQAQYNAQDSLRQFRR
jgi:hypothetical protein